MRGKLHSRCRRQKRFWITPAYAGKTQCNHIKHARERDHPRVCGENAPYGHDREAESRITPAYAGKTCHLNAAGIAQEDHPRVCGENDIDNGYAGILVGSPPRMRGKPSAQSNIGFTNGITPAHAGKTGHLIKPYPVSGGSPPRMRGKRR